MTMPGFAAEAALLTGGRYRTTAWAPMPDGGVEPAIPPCHACDRILDKCLSGELRGQICGFCAVGYCDPQDWKNPPDPFPRSEPWNVPF